MPADRESAREKLRAEVHALVSQYDGEREPLEFGKRVARRVELTDDILAAITARDAEAAERADQAAATLEAMTESHRQYARHVETLLGRFMVWASGVAFKSDEGEALARDVDAFLADPGMAVSNGGAEAAERERVLREALDQVANCRFLSDGEHCGECQDIARRALAAAAVPRKEPTP
ncbi:MAG TPA: hypothetical protein VHG72_21640 [Polyangia bacterium]|nr:hypothetical protein [Polyangia bacterium]